jgi:large subunit ribosomal protein L5
MEPRLKTHYETHARARLQEEFGFANPHRVPRLVKIVLNVGVGDASKDQKLLQSIQDELAIITGQHAVVNRARKSISNFSLREGMPVGVSVTLRQEKMWFFLDRLIATAIPRIAGCPRGPSTAVATTPWA